MTQAYGITPQGYVGKPSSQVQSEVDAGLQGILGTSSGTQPDETIPLQTKAGQLKTLITNSLSAMWDLVGSLVAQLDPNQASGSGLAVLSSLTGTVQIPASFSTVQETLTGVPGTVVPAGSIVGVPNTGSQFISTANATITGLTAWSNNSGAGTAYALGVVITANGNVYVCITPGVGATTGTGPASKASSITDGGVVWKWIGIGTGAISVLFQASVVGVIGADSGELSQIITPIFGWQSSYNLLDAVVGSLLETDASLRARRDAELHSEGGPPVDGIRTNVLKVLVDGAGVTNCTVLQNNTDDTDVNDLPPHSVMVIADYNGSDNTDLNSAIGQAIFDSVGAGIATTYGSATLGSGGFQTSVKDSQGNVYIVNWCRPVAVPIYVAVQVTYDNTPGVFPNTTDAATLIRGGSLLSGADVVGVIPTFGQAYPAGKNVWCSALISAIFGGPTDVTAGAQPLPGVLDVSIQISTAPNPTMMSPIVISLLQRAQFESVNITPIVLTGATP